MNQEVTERNIELDVCQRVNAGFKMSYQFSERKCCQRVGFDVTHPAHLSQRLRHHPTSVDLLAVRR